MGRSWTMPRRGKFALTLGAAALTATAAIAGAGSAGAADSGQPVAAKGKTFTAKPLTAAAIRKGTKDGATDTVRTDPSLLGLQGSKLVSVVVKLKYAPVASLSRQPEGPARHQPARHRPRASTAAPPPSRPTAATSRGVESVVQDGARRPRAGRQGGPRAAPRLRRRRAARAGQQGRRRAAPARRGRRPERHAAAAAHRLRARSSSAPRRSTNASSAAPTAPPGQGVIFGGLDTGVWPEHPSFADHGNLGAAAARPTARRGPATSATTR